MVDSIGKQLQQARLRKKLTIEEVARDTKIRADRIADLESDTYTNFPSIAYARGFLTMYGKHLGVDVSQFASTFESSGPQLAVASYEYLDSSAAAEPAAPRRAPSALKPILIAVALVVVGLLALVGIMLAKRVAQLAPAANVAAETPVPSPPPIAAASPSPRAIAALRPEPSPAPVATAAAASPQPDPAGAEEPIVRRAVAITPGAAAAAAGVDIMLTPKKRTFVKIQTSVEGKPLFEDWLEPEAEPIKFSGPRFWVFLDDGEGVEITKNGEPVAYESRGVWIQ